MGCGRGRDLQGACRSLTDIEIPLRTGLLHVAEESRALSTPQCAAETERAHHPANRSPPPARPRAEMPVIEAHARGPRDNADSPIRASEPAPPRLAGRVKRAPNTAKSLFFLRFRKISDDPRLSTRQRLFAPRVRGRGAVTRLARAGRSRPARALPRKRRAAGPSPQSFRCVAGPVPPRDATLRGGCRLLDASVGDPTLGSLRARPAELCGTRDPRKPLSPGGELRRPARRAHRALSLNSSTRTPGGGSKWKRDASGSRFTRRSRSATVVALPSRSITVVSSSSPERGSMRAWSRS